MKSNATMNLLGVVALVGLAFFDYGFATVYRPLGFILGGLEVTVIAVLLGYAVHDPRGRR